MIIQVTAAIPTITATTIAAAATTMANTGTPFSSILFLLKIVSGMDYATSARIIATIRA